MDFESRLSEFTSLYVSEFGPLLDQYAPTPPPTHGEHARLWKRQWHKGSVKSHMIWVVRALVNFEEQGYPWVEDLTEHDKFLLFISGVLHDIGKCGDLNFVYSTKAYHEVRGLQMLKKEIEYKLSEDKCFDFDIILNPINLSQDEMDDVLFLVGVHSIFGFLGGDILRDHVDDTFPLDLRQSVWLNNISKLEDSSMDRSIVESALVSKLKEHIFPLPESEGKLKTSTTSKQEQNDKMKLKLKSREEELEELKHSDCSVLGIYFELFWNRLIDVASLISEDFKDRLTNHRMRYLRMAICMNAIDCRGLYPIEIVDSLDQSENKLSGEMLSKKRYVHGGSKWRKLLLSFGDTECLSLPYILDLYENLGYDERFVYLREKVISYFSSLEPNE